MYKRAFCIFVFIIAMAIANQLKAQQTNVELINNSDLYTYNIDFFEKYDTIYGRLYFEGTIEYLESFEYSSDGSFLYGKIPLYRKVIREKNHGTYRYFIGVPPKSAAYPKELKYIPDFDKIVRNAIKMAAKHMKKRLKYLDRNTYKESPFFKEKFKYYPELADLDLNKLAIEKQNKLICFDYRQKKMLIYTFRNTLCFSKGQYGEFLGYYVVYDYGKQEVVRDFACITGFEEEN
jgi:hypothetical protein